MLSPCPHALDTRGGPWLLPFTPARKPSECRGPRSLCLKNPSHTGADPRDLLPAMLQGHSRRNLSSASPMRLHPSPSRPTSSTALPSVSSAGDPRTSKQMLVMVPPHPLVKHWMAILRSSNTPPAVFRNAMAELGRILTYEAARDWLPTVTGDVETPCGTAQVEVVDPSQPIAVVPILRAGIVLGELIGTTIPHSVTYHIGMVRDEETLQPSFYLNRLPAVFPPGTKILVLDCMLATGGTIAAALDELVQRNADPSSIKVVSAIAAPPALKKLSEKFPGLRVFTGIIDPGLNEKGFIVPGLGDAGDRSFGTL